MKVMWRGSLLLLLAILSSGCLGGLIGPARLKVPETAGLRTGDVVISRSGSPVSAALAWHPVYRGPYSHASVYVERPGDEAPLVLHIQTGGLQATSFARLAAGSDRIAAYRLADRAEAEELERVVQAWLGKANRGEIASDFEVREDDAMMPSFSCVEAANAMYEEAGLPRPFATGVEEPIDHWIQWYLRQTDEGLARMPNANSLATNPAFVQVGEWISPSHDAELQALHDKVAAVCFAHLQAGAELQETRLAHQLVVAGASQLGLVPANRQQIMDLKTQYMNVHRRVMRSYTILQRRGKVPADADARDSLIESLCEAHLDASFHLSPAAVPRPAP